MSVEPRDIESVVTLDGVVTAAEAVDKAAPAGGTVTAAVQSGSAVEEGATLVRIQTEAGEEVLRSDTGGVVEELFVEEGANVSSGTTLLALRPDDFVAVASVEPSLLYRFYDGPLSIVGSIDRGPSGFACDFIGMGADPDALRQGNPLQAPVTLECAVPDDLEVFSGVRIMLAVTTARATDVLALPVTAVDGDADRGVVSVVEADGSIEHRTVDLGVTDGVSVEITSGLEEGESVLSVPEDTITGGGDEGRSEDEHER